MRIARAYLCLQVKTRMQLERGKATHGLVGSFKSIIAEEGLVASIMVTLYLFSSPSMRSASDDCTEVTGLINSRQFL